jgi:transcriptional regulator with PAS, ATPase and Fis domain
LSPLRERPEDIIPPVQGLVKRFSNRFSKEVTAVVPEAVAILTRYRLPGNIRPIHSPVEESVRAPLSSQGPSRESGNVPVIFFEMLIRKSTFWQYSVGVGHDGNGGS